MNLALSCVFLIVMSVVGAELALSEIYQTGFSLAFVALVSSFIICHTSNFALALVGGLCQGVAFWLTLLGWAALGNDGLDLRLATVSVVVAMFESVFFIVISAATSLLKREPVWRASLTLSVLWLFGEAVRSHGDASMPYGELGVSQATSTLGFLLPYIGAHGVASFMVLAAYISARIGLRYIQGICLDKRLIIKLSPVFTLGSIIALLLPCSPRTLSSGGEVPAADATISTFAPRMAFDDSVVYRVAAAIRHQHSTLLVLPEGAINSLTDDASSGALRKLSKLSGVPVLSGAIIRSNARFPNAALLFVDGALKDVYVKRKLVPFGEFVPAWPYASKVFGVRGQQFVRGTSQALWPIRKGLKLSPLICYEIAFDELARSAVASGSNLIIVPANDDWFSSESGRDLQAATAATRARELGVDVVVVPTHTAPKVFHADGTSSVDLQPGFISSIVVREAHASLYAKCGDLPLICLVFGLILTESSRLLHKRCFGRIQPTVHIS